MLSYYFSEETKSSSIYLDKDTKISNLLNAAFDNVTYLQCRLEKQLNDSLNESTTKIKSFIETKSFVTAECKRALCLKTTATKKIDSENKEKGSLYPGLNSFGSAKFYFGLCLK